MIVLTNGFILLSFLYSFTFSFACGCRLRFRLRAVLVYVSVYVFSFAYVSDCVILSVYVFVCVLMLVYVFVRLFVFIIVYNCVLVCMISLSSTFSFACSYYANPFGFVYSYVSVFVDGCIELPFTFSLTSWFCFVRLRFRVRIGVVCSLRFR